MSRSDHNDAHVGLSLAVLCWNHAEFVAQCLDSIRTGSLQDLEVIIVDNGSVDGSPEVIRAFIQGHDLSWTLIENESNLGICPALNQALARAKGEFFSLISADDFFDRRKLELDVSTLSSLPPNVVLACSERVRVDRHGIPLASAAFELDDAHFVSSFPARSAIIRGSFPQSASTTMRTSALRRVGGFDERFAFEDRPVQILLSMLPDSRFVFVKGSRTFYRIHGNNMTLTGGVTERELERIYSTLFSEAALDPAERTVAQQVVRHYRQINEYRDRLDAVSKQHAGSRLALLRWGVFGRSIRIALRARACLFASLPQLIERRQPNHGRTASGTDQ